MNLLLLIFFGLNGYSNSKPECNVKNILNDCAVFKQNQDKPTIQVTENTFFTNTLYKPSGAVLNDRLNKSANPYGLQLDPDLQSKIIEDNLASQTEIIEGLQTAGIPLRSQLSLGQNLFPIVSNPDQEYAVVWPINDAKGHVQSVKGEVILAELKTKMGNARYNQLLQPILVKNKEYQEKMVEYQRQQQEEIQRQIAIREKEQAINFTKRQERKQQIQKLFEKTKQNVMQIIGRGKSPSQQTELEKALIDKVKNIKMLDPDSEEVKSKPMCLNNAQNAFYSPTYNSLSICPSLLNSPNAMLTEVLGHELSHSVDTCNFQMPRYEIDLGRLEKFLSENKLDSSTNAMLEEFKIKKTNEVFIDLELIFPNPDVLNKLIKQQIITQKKQSTPYSKYPFKSELKCLNTSESIKLNKAQDIKYTVEYFNKNEAKMKSSGARQTLHNYSKLLEKYPQCLDTRALSSQSGEVMSDMFGSIVLADYYNDKPPKTDVDKVSGIFFAGDLCTELNQQGGVDKPDYVPPKTLSSLIGVLGHSSHPGHQARLEDITFNFTPLAEKFGCKPMGKSCFDHLGITHSQMKGTNTSSINSSTGKSSEGAK